MVWSARGVDDGAGCSKGGAISYRDVSLHLCPPLGAVETSEVGSVRGVADDEAGWSEGGATSYRGVFLHDCPPLEATAGSRAWSGREVMVLGVVGTRGQCPSSPVAGRVDVRSRVIAVSPFQGWRPPQDTRPETAGVACHGGLEGALGDRVVVVDLGEVASRP